jgi:hypothetical protein
MDDSVNKDLSGEAIARKEPGRRKAERQAEADARQPDPQAELEGTGFEGRERQGVPLGAESAGGVQPLEAPLEIADEVAEIL